MGGTDNAREPAGPGFTALPAGGRRWRSLFPKTAQALAYMISDLVKLLEAMEHLESLREVRLAELARVSH